MKIREKIIEIMEDENYFPMNKEELANLFGLDRRSRKEFFKIIESLEREGLLLKDKDSNYSISENDSLLVGVLQGHERGFGFLLPEDKERGDVFIPATNLKGAVNGDKILVSIVNPATESRREEGEVVKIIERGTKKLVGRFVDNKSFGFVIPDDNKFSNDIFIAKSKINGAKNNQKVVVEITQWPDNGKNPEGVVVEVLGYLSQKGVDIVSVIRSYDLPEKFPRPILNYVENKVDKEVDPGDISRRKDLRDLKIVTIDGADAKDLDDAISIEKLDNGNYNLGVHIADVSHYVKDSSPLDEEAFNRGNSVYLLDRVIPMLPEELSNGICSLNPNEDRLCLSIFMEIDDQGNVRDNQIEETVIRSSKRLVYDDVSDFLELDSKEARKKLEGVTEELILMDQLAGILREKRQRRGSLDFNFPETRIVLDDKGVPVDIMEEERRISNRIIEEFMLVANETVAERFFWADIPFLYRVHEEPSPDKIEEFKKFAYNFGYSIKGEKNIHPKALQELLDEIQGKKEESLLSTLLLRSLKKAEYSEIPGSHFGLSSEYYTHFTAPIRRYSDLMIHRIIKLYIKGELSNNKMKKFEEEMPEIADQTSKREKRAEEAEREVDDMKKAEYMQKYVGEEFTGVVSSLTRFGIFVELENTIEGLIRFANMKDDYYNFDEDNYVVIGERSGKIYRLGEKVNVYVANASPEKREIDFLFVK